MSRRSRSPSQRYRKDGYSGEHSYSRDRERGDRPSIRDDRWSNRDREEGRWRHGERHQDRSSDHGRSRRDYDRKGWVQHSPRGQEPERARGRSRERDRQRDRDGVPLDRRSSSPRSRPRSTRPSSRAGSGSGPTSPVDKAKPNFEPSGLLAAATNTVRGVDGTSTILKYNEPPDARKPTLGWRLYVFKGSEQVELLHIHRQSAYLIGRDKLVADIPIDNPSCSKQHAVIQYRQVHEKDEFGGSKAVVKPFIIDLESTNGTLVNDDPVPTSRFYELKMGDVIKFGQSIKEYVLLHDAATQDGAD